ncbi:MAG: hypothetical protein JXA13_15065 [Anaerolineales bacterium]|nr:hypothetical protein [Anaerolineales bacterium]
MSISQPNLIGTVIFFLLIYISGFLLSQLEKPYNTSVFTFHKLVGLVFAAFLIWIIRKQHLDSPLTQPEITAIVITALVFIMLTAAGGLLSIEAAGKLENASQVLKNFISLAHKLLPYLATASTIITLYVLSNRR